MNIAYSLTYGFAYMVSLLPYRALYVLSDLAFPIVYYVIRYRRRVVRKNLTSSFPEKSEKEIKRIEKDFYHWLCDYVGETYKLLTLSREELQKHLEIRGMEKVEECFSNGQSCAALLGHYCNWEYLSTVSVYMKEWGEKAVAGLIYHPLRSASMDRLFIKLREHSGGTCIPKNEILRRLVALRNEGKMSLFGYILDQSPKWENIHLWLPFLNHDTPVFTGAERIVRKMGNAAFYMRMERPERGRYVGTFELMSDGKEELPENELTRRAFELLEADIRRNPQFYLWTHNRWKRTHEAYNQRIAEGKLKARSCPRQEQREKTTSET